MNMLLLQILGILLLLIAIAGSSIGIVYLLAKNDMQFTFAPSGEIKFITSGESVTKVIVNVLGYEHELKEDEIKKSESTRGRLIPEWLIKWFKWVFPANANWGLYFVSILYPIVRVYHYDFECDVFEGDENQQEKDVEYGVAHRNYRGVNSLYWKYPYPIVARDVEIGGNFRIKVKVRVTFEVVKPVYLIFNLHGDWFAPAVLKVIALIEAYSKEMQWEDFRVTAPDSQGEKSLAYSIVNDNGEKRKILEGSVRIAEASLVKFDAAGASEEQQKALVAVGIAKLNAQAVVETAMGKAKAIEAIGIAEGNALKATLTSAALHPDGGRVLMTEKISDAITETKVKVLSFGSGQGPIISVPLETTKTDQEKAS